MSREEAKSVNSIFRIVKYQADYDEHPKDRSKLSVQATKWQVKISVRADMEFSPKFHTQLDLHGFGIRTINVGKNNILGKENVILQFVHGNNQYMSEYI